ncbi:MAG: Zn-dependent hydrolase [Proteobacteria bacterium]|nr:MAG: Zn-dependent hydrolase [Pseudomonadota bacterium]
MDAAEIIRRCHVLAGFTEEPGRITRRYGSAAMAAAQRQVAAWMEEAGLAVRIDAVGNVRGSRESGRRLMIGSHIDTVPDAGAFDGVLGVTMGIALSNGPVEVVAFVEEEVSFLGSRSIVLDDSVAAYLEIHIEQGPVLDDLGLPLGVVDSIVGQSRCDVRFTGRAGHAGTTPMHLRSDALAAAAEWIGNVERIARETEGLVATVGRIEASPGATNAIAGEVRATLDVRHRCDPVRKAALARMTPQGSRGVAVEVTPTMDQPAVALDHEPAARAVEATGFPVHRLSSGAGHDAMILAQKIPASMLFLRSPGGISHHPDESVREGDVAAALVAGARFVADWRPR